jgi:hypothetical protein
MKGQTCEAGRSNGRSILDNETRPEQSSATQAQDVSLVRILCVAREGSYDISHEPPTAVPHGGWCGGWGVETPGYPMSITRRYAERAASGIASILRGDRILVPPGSSVSRRL